MTSEQTNSIMQGVRRAVLLSDGGELTDGQLLQRFLDQRDEAAFELLLRRHGPLVLGVCRRLLGNDADADDAFQAVFVVLVRKAAAFRGRRTVGDWLYGVAYHTALKARAATVKRRLKESQARPAAREEDHDDWSEVLPLLDKEITRLPAKLREPLVLCELQGHSRKDAAKQLAIPEGTLSSRLARARALLAKRLARCGLAITGATLAILLTPKAATAAVPASLAASTREAATAGAAAPVTALAEGVLKAMLMSKLKVVTTWALVAGVLVAGAAIWRMRMVNEARAARAEALEYAARLKHDPMKEAPKADEPKKAEADKSVPVQVRLIGPAGAKIRRFEDDDKTAKEMPCRLTFDKPGLNRLKLTNIPNRPGLELYPTVEVSPATAETKTFLTHNAVPVEFTDEEIDKAVKGQLAIRAVCLHVDGERTFAVTEAPTNDDVIGLAKKKGPLLVVARLGSIDLEAKKDSDDAYRAALIAAAHHFAGKGDLDHLKGILDRHPDLLDAKEVFRQPHKPSAGDDFTPLFAAVLERRDEVATYLLSKGANVNAVDGNDWTPLHRAAIQGDLVMVKLLVKHGAKIEAKGAGGTPLDLAVEKNKTDVAEYLKSQKK